MADEAADTLDLSDSERRSIPDVARDDEDRRSSRRSNSPDSGVSSDRERDGRGERESKRRSDRGREHRSPRKESEVLGKRARERERTTHRQRANAQKQMELFERSLRWVKEKGIELPATTKPEECSETDNDHLRREAEVDGERPHKRARDAEQTRESASPARGSPARDQDAEQQHEDMEEHSDREQEEEEEEEEKEPRSRSGSRSGSASRSASPSGSRSPSRSPSAGIADDAQYVHMKASSAEVLAKAQELGIWVVDTVYDRERRTDLARMLASGKPLYLIIAVIGASAFSAVARVLKHLGEQIYTVEFVSKRAIPFELFYPPNSELLRRRGITPIGRYTNPGQLMPTALGATICDVASSARALSEYELPIWEDTNVAPPTRSAADQAEKGGVSIRYFVLRCSERRFEACYRDGIWNFESAPFRRLGKIFFGGNTCILIVVLEGERAFHAYGYVEAHDNVRMKISWSHRNSLSFSKFPESSKVNQVVGTEPIEICSRHGEAVCSYMRNPDRGLDVDYIKGYPMLSPKHHRSRSPRRNRRGRGGSRSRGAPPRSPPRSRGGRERSPPRYRGGRNRSPPRSHGGRDRSPPRSRGGRDRSPPRSSGAPDPLKMSYAEYCDQVRRAASQRGMTVERISPSRPPVVRSRYETRPAETSRYERDPRPLHDSERRYESRYEGSSSSRSRR